MKLQKWFYGALLAAAGEKLDSDDSKRVRDGYFAQHAEGIMEVEPPVTEYRVIERQPAVILNGVANILNLWRLSILKPEDAVRIIHDITKE